MGTQLLPPEKKGPIFKKKNSVSILILKLIMAPHDH
jgi:hypothetical protein